MTSKVNPVRRAARAGSWYEADKNVLNKELETWLSEVPSDPTGFSSPIKGVKAIIAPHAGYSYSGPTSAWAYKSIDTAGIKRVFILGPSHYAYLASCALSTCTTYETPIGNLELDLETIAELRSTGVFVDMPFGSEGKERIRGKDLIAAPDEKEHSIEMHLPYIRKIFEHQEIKIVPILVGSIPATGQSKSESSYGAVLAPYLTRPDTLCVVSSDFCHWGSRFDFTSYYANAPTAANQTPPTRLSSRHFKQSLLPRPIHESISDMDHEAMAILTIPLSPPASSTAEANLTGEVAHTKFTSYLNKTHNTICGRHPIGVLFAAIGAIQRDRATQSAEGEGDNGAKEVEVKWVRYAQSSQCFDISDSSVSYASAYVVF